MLEYEDDGMEVSKFRNYQFSQKKKIENQFHQERYKHLRMRGDVEGMEINGDKFGIKVCTLKSIKGERFRF